MRALIIIVFAALALAGCTTTNVNTFSKDLAKPPAGAKILLVQPDIELGLLTAAGLQEPRADWSSAARTNIASAMQQELAGRKLNTMNFNPANAMEGRTGQIIRLHNVVGASVLAFHYGAVSLPTKKDQFDWTLGEGVQELRRQTGADYAIFVFGRGSYASGGRVATSFMLAVLGVAVPLGGQQMFVSLVDLNTGRVIWFNVVTAGPDADMRKPEGAASLAKSLFKDAPL